MSATMGMVDTQTADTATRTITVHVTAPNTTVRVIVGTTRASESISTNPWEGRQKRLPFFFHEAFAPSAKPE